LSQRRSPRTSEKRQGLRLVETIKFETRAVVRIRIDTVGYYRRTTIDLKGDIESYRVSNKGIVSWEMKEIIEIDIQGVGVEGTE
jgi:hypothetical protein